MAALAEAYDDEMRMAARNLVMITVGTGVGGGLVLGGRIYRGASGAAGELGHTLIGLDLSGPVPPAGRFPQHGSLERVAAGRALDRMIDECIELHPSSSLARRREAGETVLGAEAVQAAHDGDRDAAEVVERWAEHLGIGVANAINTFDPEEVVIGGGAAQAGDLLLNAGATGGGGIRAAGTAGSGDDPDRPSRRPGRGVGSGAAGRPRAGGRGGRFVFGG